MASRTLNSVIEYIRKIKSEQGAAGLTDGQLLGRFLTNRDEEAFAALMKRHGPLVLSVCRRILQNMQDTEDAFQATFLVLVRNARSIAKRDSVASWLHGVAHRIAIRAKARRGRLHAAERKVPRIHPADSLNEVLWSDLGVVLDEEVQRLPERYRAPFILCYMQGKTNEEAAYLLGCPAGTIMSRLSRARERLRRRLVRRRLDLSAGLVAARVSQASASAPVPPTLTDSTIRAALLVGQGRVVASVSSASVALLVQGLEVHWVIRIIQGAVLLLLAIGLSAFGERVWTSAVRTAIPSTDRVSIDAQFSPAITVRARQPLDKSVRALEIKAHVGDIKVVRSPNTEMTLTAVVSADTSHIDSARIGNQFEQHVRVAQSRDVLTVADAHKDAADRAYWRVSLEVALPRALPLDARVEGPGDVFVENAAGSVCMTSSAGSLTLTSEALDSVYAETGAGDATLQIGRLNHGLRVDTGAGTVTLRLGDGRPSRNVTLINGAGNVSLELPQGAGGRLAADTGAGAITVEGLAGIRVVNQDGFGARAQGRFGEGGARYKVITGAGNITVRMANSTSKPAKK